MGLYYIFAFALLLVGLKFNGRGYYDDFLSLPQANAVKGFFILLVFISHSLTMVGNAGYSFPTALDKFGDQLQTHFGQLIVAMFLFYSGYGVMESLAHKGRAYLQSYPKRRLLTTLLNFDVAVLFFLLLDYAIGIHYNFRHILYSLLAWKSVGNTEWYIFAILFCYVAFYSCSLLFSSNPKRLAFSVLLLSLAYMIAISFKKQHWWYDTILCFPTGVLFSVYKEQIIPAFKRWYYPILLFLFFLFLFLHCSDLPDLRGLTYNLQSISFALLIVLLTMKLKSGNRAINWLGTKLFPIYVYQCIPMLLVSGIARGTLVADHPHLCIILCLAVTLLFALGYEFWRIQLD